jgi:RHS repeat-associated protein
MVCILGGILLGPSEVVSAQSYQFCPVIFLKYFGSVSLVGGPGCAPGYPHIGMTIFGPDSEPAGQGANFDDTQESGCPVGILNVDTTSFGPPHDGHYQFSGSYLGPYMPSDLTDGAECGPALCGCFGGANIELYPIDEPPEVRGGAPGGEGEGEGEGEGAGEGEGEGEGEGGYGGGPNPNVGCPVNVLNGNVWFDQTDIRIPGVGRRLALVRSYNSKLAGASVGGAFGRGWFHRFESKLNFFPWRGIKLRKGNGEPIFFEDPTGSGTYAARLPKTETSSIVKSGAIYTRYFRIGGSEAYDANGFLISLTDTSGNMTTLTRDPSGNLLAVADSGGRSLSFSYDGSGHITAVTGPLGVIASYVYDVNGFLQAVTYGDGSGYTFAYDASGRVLSVTDVSGRVLETHTYDTNGNGITSECSGGQHRFTIAYGTRQSTVTDALGNVSSYRWTSLLGITRRIIEIEGGCPSCGGGGQNQQWSYDNNGRALSRTDAFGNTRTYTYNASGDLLTKTDPLSHLTTYTYDAQGRILSITRPDGGVTTYTYGPSGPLTITQSVTSTQNRTTTLVYNTQGKLGTVTDARNKTTTLGYNAFGDLTSATDPLNHATGFGYDALGRRTSVTDPLNHSTTAAYDARGHVTRITNPDNTHTDFTYDLGGRRTSVTDPLGQMSSYSYDTYGRPQSVVDPLEGVTRYAYDAMSNLISLTDARGKVTSFSYDNFNDVSRVTYPGGASESFTYDEGGRLKTKTDRKSVVTTYTYDTLGRVAGKSYSDSSPAVTYGYDVVGRLASAGNGTDTLTWTYDLAGQFLSEQSVKNASTVVYTYDLGGNRLTLSLNGTLFVSYGPDDASRLATIARGSNTFTFGYDNANRRTSLAVPNGINTSYSYDNLNRLTILTAVLGSTTITSSAYTYDNAGNRLTKTTPDYSEGYSYDPLNKLTAANRNGTANQWVYSYDAVGNRITNQADSVVSSATYNDSNQLVSQTGGGPLRVRGHLDKPGTVKVNGQSAQMLAGNVFQTTINATAGTNTISVVATDVSGNVRSQNYQITLSGIADTFTSDPNGNVTQKVEGSLTWTYTWDVENRLTQVQSNGTTVATFAYDPLGRRVQKVAGGVTTSWTYDGPAILQQMSGGSALKYIHGPGVDEPLASDDGTALTYFQTDGLGSIVKATNSSGAVTLTRQYDAWGNLQLGATTNGFAFTGREWDSETGLYYFRARYYDSRLGRFLREDPIGFRGGTNFYSYVLNNPVNLTDPSGEDVRVTITPLPPPPDPTSTWQWWIWHMLDTVRSSIPMPGPCMVIAPVPTATTFVGQENGPPISIPPGSTTGPARGNGTIYYAPGGKQIRIMGPTPADAPYQYPYGYVRVTAPDGQALDPRTGLPVPTNSDAAHCPLSCPNK